MKALTKRIKTVQTLFDKAKAYGLKESIAILKKTPKLKTSDARVAAK